MAITTKRVIGRQITISIGTKIIGLTIMDSMNLFDYMRQNSQEKESPLAARMRPTTLDEVVGQKHINGKDKLL